MTDKHLVTDFAELLITPGVDHELAISKMAEHPKEAHAALDQIILRTHHIRRSIEEAVAKRLITTAANASSAE